MNEEIIWKPIPEFPKYQISSNGEVYSLKTRKILKPYDTGTVQLSNEKILTTFTIPTLMGCTFLGNDINDPYRNRVLFKDGNLKNWKLANLYVEDTSDLPGEVWKPLLDYQGTQLEPHYQISNKGRLKACKHIVKTSLRGKPIDRHVPDIIIKAPADEFNYRTTALHTLSGKDVIITIHRAVALTFCENDDPEHKIFINHIDGDKLNNCADNLEWCTPSHNTMHAIEHGMLTVNKDLFNTCPLKCIETGIVYPSKSAASLAMGRNSGYLTGRFKKNRPCYDKDGNTWTFEPVDNSELKITSNCQRCIIDEFPDREFATLAEACAAIGRYNCYIGDRLRLGKPVYNINGELMHVHLKGAARCTAGRKASTNGFVDESKM